MNVSNFNKIIPQATALIAPLNWGLGHATRCIPVINELLKHKVKVIVAADGQALSLLKKELIGVEFLPLAGYNIRYSRHKFLLPFVLLMQVPKLMMAIYKENQWLKRFVKKNNINFIIADNRLGFYHKTICSIYITHQLKIKTGNQLSEWILQKIHYFFIDKFNFCWVPDAESKNNLAGDLAHPTSMPNIPIAYLGSLSRFVKTPQPILYDCLLLLSGPEPQRTVLENIFLQQLKNYDGKFLMVRGLPNNEKQLTTTFANGKLVNYLNTPNLNVAMLQAKIIVCRSGYTTIMDLCKLEKKAILIPTPGQTEQEYLANYLQQEKYFFSTTQQNFNLQTAILSEQKFNYLPLPNQQENYVFEIEKLISQVSVTPPNLF
jgi:UDP-N-acetylglucosamine transferase subunit ALG13